MLPLLSEDISKIFKCPTPSFIGDKLFLLNAHNLGTIMSSSIF